jgi:hypothetical protein
VGDVTSECNKCKGNENGFFGSSFGENLCEASLTSDLFGAIGSDKWAFTLNVIDYAWE